MNYDEFKYKLVQTNSGSEAFNSGVKQANSRAKRIFKNMINKYIIKRSCNTCKYSTKTASEVLFICNFDSMPIKNNMVHESFYCKFYTENKELNNGL